MLNFFFNGILCICKKFMKYVIFCLFNFEKEFRNFKVFVILYIDIVVIFLIWFIMKKLLLVILFFVVYKFIVYICVYIVYGE